ncbi:MAG: cutinase family protein [Rhodococcus sp.]|nr:cutinase family protein [Rhodococcus sp. (in: high G+C Gram-positive bacteria)]
MLVLGLSSTVSPSPAYAAPERIHPLNEGASCPDVLIVAASGASDSGADRDPLNEEERTVWGNWINNVTVPSGERFAERPESIGWAYVPYPSSVGLGWEPFPTYQESVRAALESTHRILDDTKASCGERTKFILVGYSIGGEIMHRVATQIGNRSPSGAASTASGMTSVTADDILGVALVASPYRPAGSDSFGEAGPPGGGFMSSEPAQYGALSDRVIHVCRRYDAACDAPRRIAILDLALQVLGQMQFALSDPGRTVSDFDAAIRGLVANVVIDTVHNPQWFDSDESYLDVLRRAADRTENPEVPELTAEELADAVRWATGEGAPLVREKLRREGPRFIEDNRDVFDMILQPYIFLGFVQHMLYWNNNPTDQWYWESEKIVDWVAELAIENGAR